MRWVRVVFAVFVLAGTGAAVLPGTAGAAVPAATVPTSTTLTASSTSTTQDSWVTFTAQVGASGVVPEAARQCCTAATSTRGETSTPR